MKWNNLAEVYGSDAMFMALSTPSGPAVLQKSSRSISAPAKLVRLDPVCLQD